MTDRTIRVAVFCLASALAAFSQPAAAKIEFPTEYKCPVGGEKFTQMRRAAWTEYGKRPDGKVYSNWVSPTPLPECPSNGLVIVGEYSKEDIARLAPLIASAEYASLRKGHSAYYRAAWLLRKLDRDPKTVLAMLQRAGWDSDDQPERHKRYLREMVDQSHAVLGLEKPGSMPWWQVNWMVLNALRELSARDEASAMLAALPLAELDVTVPEKKLGEPPFIEEQVSPFPGMPPVKRKRENVVNAAEISEARTRAFLFRGFNAQRILISEGNSGAEPVSLIPEGEQLRRCKWFAGSLTASETAVCSAPGFADRVKSYAGPRESNYD